ncbi:MAG: deoxyguanosinetriphosphate triphosphohydrolase [Candidatus Omnitrophica bacterium]|nr:deoxyguanosinetriphosphate triphosphohydrolase [Candidatus Omnitrophota bacterium]
MTKIKLQKNINTNEKYTWQDYEEKILSPLAMKSKYSKGRKHYEKEHPYRSLYQRDRDRIIHCAAFRRLEYKTQVFVYHEGDYFRTRLTHTLEVAQIARTISRNLKLNDDLTEAIALVHDVGHTPFGHAVEAVLNELMQDDGGFNHNEQGLRVVDFLEERYPSFKGLNLSWETREGIVKHSTNHSRNFAKRYAEFKPNEQPSLETQVMDVSDEIAYDNHDVDDGIKSGLIFEDDLRKKSKLWSMIYKKVKTEHSNLNDNLSVYLTIRNLINRQVTDLLDNTSRNIKKFKLGTFKEVRSCNERVVAFSPEMNSLRSELREFLFKNLYCNWHVLRMTDKAKRFVSALFDIYLHNPQLLPPPFRNVATANGIKRTICDYLAGMTDKYA